MQRDVGANQRGELAGFMPERAEELVKASAAEAICTFDPSTHRFEPTTETLVELSAQVEPVIETVPPFDELTGLAHGENTAPQS